MSEPLHDVRPIRTEEDVHECLMNYQIGRMSEDMGMKRLENVPFQPPEMGDE